MKRIRALSTFFFLLLFLQSFGQTNFFPGYYITLHNDTISGYIENRFEDRNNRVCTYKSQLSSRKQKFNPDSIRGYAINGVGIYESHAFTNRKNEPVKGFFKVVARGKVSLFRYHGNYFVRDEEGKFYDLSKNDQVEGRKVKQDNYAIGILKVLLNDCEDVKTRIERIYHRKQDVEEIFKQYHACTKEITFIQKTKKTRATLTPGLSASLTSTDVSFKDHTNAKFDKTLSPQAGLFVSLFIPRINENFRLLLEMLYGQNETYAFFQTPNYNNDFFISYSYLKLPLLVRFNKGIFFIEGGMADQFILEQELQWRTEFTFFDEITTADQRTKKFDRHNISFILGGGANIRLAGMEIRPSIRFSQHKLSNHLYEPSFQSLEFNIKVNLQR